MTPLLLIHAALAGWTENARTDECVFYLGEKKGSYATIRAECNWAVAPSKVQGLLAKLADHDLYFSSVASAELVSGNLYRQVHQASGISNREVILEMGSDAIAGGTRYWWKKAADQSALTGGNVEAVADTGKWEITANADGTTHAIYELYYDPGGSVPTFLVRWFQTSGTQQLVNELKVYATK